MDANYRKFRGWIVQDCARERRAPVRRLGVAAGVVRVWVVQECARERRAPVVHGCAFSAAVHGWRGSRVGPRCTVCGGSLDDDLFDIEFDLFLGRRGRGGGSDDGERGLQFDGGRGFGVGQDVLDGLDGEVDEVFDFFAVVEGPVVLGVSEALLEGERIATPVS